MKEDVGRELLFRSFEIEKVTYLSGVIHPDTVQPAVDRMHMEAWMGIVDGPLCLPSGEQRRAEQGNCLDLEDGWDDGKGWRGGSSMVGSVA